MAVIALPKLSPQGPNPLMSWELRSITAINLSGMSGVATTLERPGAHWAATFRYSNLKAERRARMQQFLVNCRGHGSRFYVPYYGWTNRGAFSASELVSNNQFASGTTGWSLGTTDYALTVADGFMRLRRAGNFGVSHTSVAAPSSLTVVAYAPYLARALFLAGRGTFTALTPRLATSLTSYETSGAPSALLSVAMSGDPATTATFSIADLGGAGPLAGDYFSCAYTSVARCALVDNGPNLLLQSEEFDATWTQTRVTVDDQSTTAPDGTATADTIQEDGTAANSHLVTQSVTVSSADANYSLGCSLKAGTRNWACLELFESGSSHTVRAFINLSTGALGTVVSSGANWTNPRAFVVDEGNGWYRLHVLGRKVGAATTLAASIIIAEADNDITFSGLTANSLFAWRATLAASGVPTRGRQTTSSATSGTSQTGGGLHLKGLPASTDALLLAGDIAEVITATSSQLVRARQSLNSDAAGLGYFEFEPPLRVSPSDGAAVIVQRPLCKMMLDSNTVKWTEHSGGFCDLEFTAVEDTYP